MAASKDPNKNRERRYFEIKSDGEDGTFTGMLSSYGMVDGGNDSVEPGAYAKTIVDNKGQVPLLYNHDPDQPIGMAELIDTPEGLMIKGTLLLGVQRAAETYQLIKAGIMKGLSIGFKAMQKEVKDGVRFLKEIKLFEGSVVLWPMDPTAQIMSVKSLQDGTSDFTEEVDEMQAACAGSQMLSVLQDGLCSAWWSVGSSYNPVDPAVRLRFCEGMIGEFKAAFLAAMVKFSAMAEDPEDQDEMDSMIMMARTLELERKSGGKTKRVDGEDLPSSAFLIVGDPQKTDTWKLPVKFSDDAKTKSHIRNALARVGQVQGASAEEIARAKTKLAALAKEHGIDAAKAAEELELEAKAGAKISAATAEHMKQAKDHLSAAITSANAAHGVLSTLMSPPAADGTGYKAAVPEKTEPEIVPLALDWIAELKALRESFEQQPV